MQTTTEQNAVIEKTRELCQAILDDPQFQSMRRNIETFMSNASAQGQYQSLSEKGEYLQHKQQQGVQLTPEEISAFERDREAFLGNPVAAGFLDAQQTMHKMQETVGQYVAKTFELGRVPEAEDFAAGDCGPSCGCAP
jgi:cell fate (sporulation/competence/biofilm development) regulator YlbF (YheA/YmcA/DUF963 family)